MIGGIRQAIDRIDVRRETRNAGLATSQINVDSAFQDGHAVLQWSIAAAFLGLDGQESQLQVGEVLTALCFKVEIASADLQTPPQLLGPSDTAILTVQAGLRVKTGFGSFSDLIPSSRVAIRLDSGSTQDVLLNNVFGTRSGQTDATGRFSTTVNLGEGDTALIIQVAAGLPEVDLASRKIARGVSSNRPQGVPARSGRLLAGASDDHSCRGRRRGAGGNTFPRPWPVEAGATQFLARPGYAQQCRAQFCADGQAFAYLHGPAN